jgi:hypothetical protein
LLPNGSGGPGKINRSSGASGSNGGAGSTRVAPVPHGQPSASAPGGSTSGIASRNGGKSQGGSGSTAPGRPGTRPGRSTTRAAAAGTAGGGTSRGKGVVPQLGGSRGVLPLTPGYEAIPGSKGATDENASSTVGRGGGAGHSGQAIGGAASSGGGAGVPYVPPGGAAVASIDRGVVLGYFASFARVSASGW